MRSCAFCNTLQIAVVAILATALSAGTALAEGNSGKWPMTITQSQHSNGTNCATLTDNGSLGWPHSGPASLPGGSTGTLFGTFQVIDGLLIMTFEAPSGTGQNAGLVFIGGADKGRIGKGVFEDVYGGEAFDSGVLTFGTRNGC